METKETPEKAQVHAGAVTHPSVLRCRLGNGGQSHVLTPICKSHHTAPAVSGCSGRAGGPVLSLPPP